MGDNCPFIPNFYQTYTDSDGLCDACDANDDALLDDNANCPTIVNDDQVDLDWGNIGDDCDIDINGQEQVSHFEIFSNTSKAFTISVFVEEKKMILPAR